MTKEKWCDRSGSPTAGRRCCKLSLVATRLIVATRSDAEERQLLEKYSPRIAPHRFIAEEILAWLCADADANRGEYVRAGRLGTLGTLARLKQLTGVLA
jgi:hypothetical protein